MQLRPYQLDAVRAASRSIQDEKNPLIVLPTGTGKSLVIADITRRAVAAGRRVLVLTHVRELIAQNYAEFCALQPFADAGIYSAGMKRKDRDHAVIFAGIQSYVSVATEAGVFDYVIIDEAHRIPPDGTGQYQQVLTAERAKNPGVRIIGLTATPYRVGQGMLTEGDDALLDEICYQANFLDLVADGYLAPVVSRHGISSADLSGVHTRRGEYVEVEAAAAFMAVLPAHVDGIVKAGQNRKKWLIFAQSVIHAEALHAALSAHVPCGLVHGGVERDEAIDAFKSGALRALVNVNILTTGFNAPDIDMVVLCRATQSTSLYVQMVGRGTQIAQGKTDCLILDYGGNIERHGPIDCASQRKPGDGLPPMKSCPECGMIHYMPVMQCGCGYEFPATERNTGKDLTTTATNGGITSEEPIRIDVDDVIFVSSRTRKGDDCILIEFMQEGERWPAHREYLLLWHEHPYARAKGWRILNAVTNGQAAEFENEDPDIIAAVCQEAYEAREFPKIDYIMLLRNQKNPKYFDLIAWGGNDATE